MKKYYLLTCLFLTLGIGAAFSQFTVLYNFSGTAGYNPAGPLTQCGPRLFGVQPQGLTYPNGCVFSINLDGSDYKDIHDFNQTSGGYSPTGALAVKGGVLYGMCCYGGANSKGTIFSLDTNGSAYTDMYDFTTTTGNPYSQNSLVLEGNMLFGLLGRGGAVGAGMSFSIQTNGHGFKDLHDFGVTTYDAAYPYGYVTVSGNMMYGMTYNGGQYFDGAVWKMDTNGTAYSKIYDMDYPTSTEPLNGAPLLSGTTLYCLSEDGGTSNEGTLFSIQTNGSGYTILHNFDSAHGYWPYASLTMAGGKLWGLTYQGGANNFGVLFSIDTMGVTYTDLVNFNNGANGEYPESTLLLSGGSLYGTTSGAGANGWGTLFKYFDGTCNLNATIATTELTCFGANNGIETANATGGTTPYTYTWSTGATTSSISGLPVGLYSVTVQDANGCTFSTGYSMMNQPALLQDSISESPKIYCSGGTTTLTDYPYGGTPIYSFSWTPSGSTTASLSGVSTGTYTVTVTDAHGCTVTTTINVAPTKLRDSIASSTSVLCNGGSTGSATVGVKYGTPPYTYYWSTVGRTSATATGLSAGSYTVTVTDDHGCTATASVSITQPGALVITAAPTAEVSCFGESNGSADVTQTGGTSPYTYSWSGGGTNSTKTGLSAATYTVTVTDHNGCSATEAVTITQPNVLNVSAISYVWNVSCFGGSNGRDSAIVVGGTPPYTYVWTPGGQTNEKASGLSAGTYTVTVTDHNGCTATAAGVINQPPLLTVSASVTANVSCNGGNNGAANSNPAGGTPAYTFSWAPNGGSNSNATSLTAGTYTVTLTDNNGCSATASVNITQPPVLAVTTTVTAEVSCNGGSNGSASCSATGGTSPYTYSWSGGGSTSSISGKSAGTYTITIFDIHGCTATAKAVITQPVILTVTSSVLANVSCNGGDNGSAKATVSGGTSPYTYSWVPSGNTNATITGLTVGTYTVDVTDSHGCTATASVTITQPPILTVTASVTTNVSCHGGNNGSATGNASGGTSPYSYSWSPGGNTNVTATGLTAGTYTVIVTDNHGCTATSTGVTITQPATALAITIASHTNVVCHGGTGTASANAATGGTSPYTYSWTPSGGTNLSASGLSAATYTITATDNHGCIATATVTITQPALLTVTATATANVSCNGGNNGSASATPSGGTSPYTYAWSGGGSSSTKTALTAGTYTINVDDNHGCTASATVTITQPAAIRDSIVSSSIEDVKCYGVSDGQAKVGVKGGTSPYSYLWSPSGKTTAAIIGLSAGTYSVTITDKNGCTSSAKATITQPAEPLKDSVSSFSCVSHLTTGTVGVKGGTSPYTYSWLPGSYRTATVTGLSNGTYTITVADKNGCTASVAATFSCAIAPPPGDVDKDKPNCCPDGGDISLYPNPNTGQFTLSGLEKGMIIEVYDYTGRKISSQLTIDNLQVSINISAQPNGIFLIRILDKDGILVSSKKVVKTQ